MRRGVAMICGALAVAGCSVNTPQARVPLSEAAVLDGGSYSTGGGLTLAAELREIGGKTALCGVWAESEAQSILSKGQGPNVLGSGAAYLDGQALVRGLGFFAKTDPADSYAGAEAGCRVTDRTWQPGDEARALTLGLPRRVVHRETDSDGAMSINVIFRPTGPGA